MRWESHRAGGTPAAPPGFRGALHPRFQQAPRSTQRPLVALGAPLPPQREPGAVSGPGGDPREMRCAEAAARIGGWGGIFQGLPSPNTPHAISFPRFWLTWDGGAARVPLHSAKSRHPFDPQQKTHDVPTSGCPGLSLSKTPLGSPRPPPHPGSPPTCTCPRAPPVTHFSRAWLSEGTAEPLPPLAYMLSPAPPPPRPAPVRPRSPSPWRPRRPGRLSAPGSSGRPRRPRRLRPRLGLRL